jgi:hypothetical protein
VYPKISGDDNPFRHVWVNNAVREDLVWAANHIESLSGIHIIRSRRWDLESADLVVYCDASMEGLGCWFPDHGIGLHSPIPAWVTRSIIFYHEALAVATALDRLSHNVRPHCKIVIFTDNSNTVTIFNTLRCLPEFNPLLKYCVDILLMHHYDLRVRHVPGHENVVADALSRGNFDLATRLAPDLEIQPFEPPRFTLGAAKK